MRGSPQLGKSSAGLFTSPVSYRQRATMPSLQGNPVLLCSCSFIVPFMKLFKYSSVCTPLSRPEEAISGTHTYCGEAHSHEQGHSTFNIQTLERKNVFTLNPTICMLSFFFFAHLKSWECFPYCISMNAILHFAAISTIHSLYLCIPTCFSVITWSLIRKCRTRGNLPIGNLWLVGRLHTYLLWWTMGSLQDSGLTCQVSKRAVRVQNSFCIPPKTPQETGSHQFSVETPADVDTRSPPKCTSDAGHLHHDSYRAAQLRNDI